MADQVQGLSVIAQVQSSREMEEVKGMIFMAKQYPRDVALALSRIKQACSIKEVAEDGLYSYPRGKDEDGKQNMVTGPSIRLAEIIAQSYGNFSCGTIELERDKNSSKLKAYAWDVETNFRDEKIFDVPLFRSTKKGGYTLTDPRDIYEATANQGARRKRSCILAVIPRYITDAAESACKETMARNIDTKEFTAKIVKAFESLKITVPMIEKYTGKKIGQLSIDDLTELKAVFNSIRDNVAKAGEYFEGFAEPNSEPKEPTETPLDKKLREQGAANGN